MTHSMRPLAAAVALAITGPCLAADVTINANPNMSFSPSTVTIEVGDTVTFHNNGGFHNVAADDGSWRCSNSCGSGGAGALSSDSWTSSRTFNEAGTVGYHCQAHGAPGSGMFGTIIVEDNGVTEPPIALGGYLSGAWYTIGQGGHGFLLEFTNVQTALEPDDTYLMIASWYVYQPDDSGTRDWVWAEGNYNPDSNSATINAAVYAGSRFPPAFDSDDVVETAWGTLTFTFTSCTTGEVHWQSVLPGYGSGTLPLQRLTQIAGTECPTAAPPADGGDEPPPENPGY